MKARDILSPQSASVEALPERNVSADMPVVDLLPRLLDTADHRLGVTDGKDLIGVVDEISLLNGLNALISPRDDSSSIVLEVSPSAYSASHIAHAVEDADVHLVDLWSTPAGEELLRVTLRVRTDDPSGVVSSLERYGYSVVESSGETDRNMETAIERLLSLNALLKV